MKIINHQPNIKIFGNGFQITFPNKYTVLVKSGVGTKTTQSKKDDDLLAMVMSTRFGGANSPDVEVEVYDPNTKNITEKFGEEESLGFVNPIKLVNLLYVVSGLK